MPQLPRNVGKRLAQLGCRCIPIAPQHRYFQANADNAMGHTPLPGDRRPSNRHGRRLWPDCDPKGVVNLHWRRHFGRPAAGRGPPYCPERQESPEQEIRHGMQSIGCRQLQPGADEHCPLAE